MKILTQNLKSGKTNILEVPSPSINSNKIRVINKFSLISTGTESTIVNFGKASWINKAKQQPDRVKDVINKIKSSGLGDTIRAIKNKLNYPMPMGYASVGTISHTNEKFKLIKGDRVFTNSFHQEEALIEHNMCVPIPKNVDDKSASFGAIGGIAMQSIKCIDKDSKFIAVIGLGLLGQVTLRILKCMGYECIVYDINSEKIRLAEKFGAIGIKGNDIEKEILNFTNGIGVDCTIIAASSLSNDLVNNATIYTKRKGKIISSGLIGLNLVRDNFFKKQINFVVSNSSGDKNHRGQGSSFENISYFFELLSSNKVEVLDLISDEVCFDESSSIYDFNSKSLFFSRLIKYKLDKVDPLFTILEKNQKSVSSKLKVGFIGIGNFALSTLMPVINNSNEGYLFSLLGREGLSLSVAQKRFKVNKITTNDNDFYNGVDVICVSTPHHTHYNFLKKAIELSLSIWVEKPMVINMDELLDIKSKMHSKELTYAVGFNRSKAPWTEYVKERIKSKKTKIKMTINAGKLPQDHWLLNKEKYGGRIIGEFSHFIDLSLKILSHAKLIRVECIRRDLYFQDTGNYILHFDDGSISNIDYRHDLPSNLPKEKIIVEESKNKFINNNWKKFLKGNIPNIFIGKGKGHKESIESFFKRVKNDQFSNKTEIDNMCFSTYCSIKLQKMSQGDVLNILDSYNQEILSKH
tara:strand:- start:9957 stop:12032 length:2076 start_codon:yes stop_codon:yes gene_type:complete